MLGGAVGEYGIRVIGEAEDVDRESRSLARWLRDDDAIRTSALVKLTQAPPRPGEMGGAFDVVQLVVDSGFQLGNLALAYAAWRGSRSRPSAVTVEHRGRRVTLDTTDPEEIARILAALGEDGD
ncbi:hypothetical protein ACGFYZ_23560 [Streptomyces sp. NPDC048330]|uniref:effector-associated constant component EACC1 n=1 Tax=Streptomyces sp. NPDC048330 TaxID=3365533 RepID=UPI003721AF4E